MEIVRILCHFSAGMFSTHFRVDFTVQRWGNLLYLTHHRTNLALPKKNIEFPLQDLNDDSFGICYGYKIFNCLLFMTNIINFTVLLILLMTEITRTHTGIRGFEHAAIIFMVSVGLEPVLRVLRSLCWMDKHTKIIA